MSKCSKCKYFTGNAIAYAGKYYLCCKIEGLIGEDVAEEDNLECDLYVEDVDDN